MSQQVTYQEYLNFLKKYPKLNVDGYSNHVPERYRKHSAKKFFEEWNYRRKVLESEEGFEQFLVVLAWFAKYPIQRTKYCNLQSHSYHLKHIVEEEYRHYIYNGSFIAGALFCGCTMSTRVSVLNPSFNLKYSCIKKTEGWLKIYSNK